MPPSKLLQLRISGQIREALDDYCADHKLELSALVRSAICKEIGHPELLDTMPPEGRPKTEPGKRKRTKRKTR